MSWSIGVRNLRQPNVAKKSREPATISGPSIVFLDRDGVINRKVPGAYFIRKPDEFEFLSGVPEAIQLLNHQRCYVVVVTNQRGVSVGALTEQELQQLHEFMTTRLRSVGARIDAIYYCPHAVEDLCGCRKPGTALFLRAFSHFSDADRSRSIVIGDSACDMEAAHRLNCRRVLITNDDVTNTCVAPGGTIPIDFFASSLLQAVRRFIIPLLKVDDSRV